ncbi:MAG: AAA family ATPase [bacterium]|nr:AAA family ATPase [bacterium]
MITRLHIQNFKSLRDVVIDPMPPFMVLVGANSSGKSNFVKALEFLFSVMREGLSNSVDKFGGYENICYRRIRRSKKAIRFDFELEWDNIRKVYPGDENQKSLIIGKINWKYSFAFQSSETTIDSPYEVPFENFEIEVYAANAGGRLFHLLREKGKPLEWELDKKVTDSLKKSELLDFFQPAIDNGPFFHEGKGSSELIVAGWNQNPLLTSFLDYFDGCRTYHLIPDEARQPVRDIVAAGTLLNAEGTNLAAIIRYLQKEIPDSYEELFDHLKIVVPTLESINLYYTDNKQLSYNFKESGIKRPWHLKDISDGSIQALALFTPLVHEDVQFAAYDEPENSVHPWIQKHFVRTCVEESEGGRQIVLATHSTDIVNEVPPKSLYIIERNRRGETIIRSALEKNPELIEIVDEKIMKPGEYWESGALGGVPVQLPLFDEDEEE